MSALRETKRKVRRELHARASVPAVYLLTRDGEPQEVFVRLFTTAPGETGDVRGFESAAERRDFRPKILFMRDEVSLPAVNAIVSVEEGEAYRIGAVMPADDISVTCEVVRLSGAKAAGLPVPDNPEGEYVAHPGIKATSFTHTQAVAATSWTINHGFAFKPTVTVFNEAGDQMGCQIEHTATGVTVVSFNSAVAGSARCH